MNQTMTQPEAFRWACIRLSGLLQPHVNKDPAICLAAQVIFDLGEAIVGMQTELLAIDSSIDRIEAGDVDESDEDVPPLEWYYGADLGLTTSIDRLLNILNNESETN